MQTPQEQTAEAWVLTATLSQRLNGGTGAGQLFQEAKVEQRDGRRLNAQLQLPVLGWMWSVLHARQLATSTCVQPRN